MHTIMHMFRQLGLKMKNGLRHWEYCCKFCLNTNELILRTAHMAWVYLHQNLDASCTAHKVQNSPVSNRKTTLLHGHGCTLSKLLPVISSTFLTITMIIMQTLDAILHNNTKDRTVVPFITSVTSAAVKHTKPANITSAAAFLVHELLQSCDILDTYKHYVICCIKCIRQNDE